jgi:hypothetical protein
MAQDALDQRGLVDQRDQSQRLRRQLFSETGGSPAGGYYSHGSLGETRPPCAEVS